VADYGKRDRNRTLFLPAGLISKERGGCRWAQVLPRCDRTPRKMGLTGPVATALGTGQFDIANVNLHFYWVFGQSNICWGEFWSRPQYVVNRRCLGAPEERESPSASRLVADARSTSALSPQSVAIMPGSVNRRGCRWRRASLRMAAAQPEDCSRAEYRRCTLGGVTKDFYRGLQRTTGSRRNVRRAPSFSGNVKRSQGLSAGHRLR